MRKRRKLLSVILALAMISVLCACGGGSDVSGPKDESKAGEAVAEAGTADAGKEEADADKSGDDSKADSGKEDESKSDVNTSGDADALAAEEILQPKELPIEGEYKAFAVLNDGYLVEADGLGLDSAITLSDGGTGKMAMIEETMDITSWTMEGTTVTLTLADESTADGVLQNGIIELDIYGTGTMLVYYAQEEADTSFYKPMTVEEFQEVYNNANTPDTRLHALLESIDATAGMHLNYDLHVDYMDANQTYDVHERDCVYYSDRKSKVAGYEREMVTFAKDGLVYNLYPDKMTGIVVTSIPSFTADTLAQMDSLYLDIVYFGSKTEYTEETREKDGVSYTVEVFPATDYTPEAAFYYNDDGQLAYYIKGAPVIELAQEVGESVYTIHAIDTEVDETLFDISGYQIAE